MTGVPDQPLSPRLSRAEQQLLDEVAAGRPVAVLVRTGTTVDVGEWFRRGRVLGVCAGGEWVMLAPGKRPYVERVATPLLAASVYNPLVGKLVLAPAPGVQLRQLRLSPLEAGRALRWILNVSDEVTKEMDNA
jgi:hypothetical protein